MTQRLLPYDLSWTEVDPRLHVFDAACALAEVTALGPASQMPVRPQGRPGDRAIIDWSEDGAGGAWTDDMTQALVERYGRWATGWRWARNEADIGGGPVSAWCCPSHSMYNPGETLAKVAGGLCEWRSWLEELAELFDRFAVDAESAEDRRVAWERGTLELVTRVVDRTEAGHTWFGHCRQVLIWFLTRWGVAADTAQEQVKNAISGEFGSWVAPEAEVVGGVAARLGTARHRFEQG